MTTFHAFIPAAGIGERLRPVTDHIPKPLLPVLGRPVIDRVLERVAKLPVDKIGINLHHKEEMIRRWLTVKPPFPGIVLFQEDTILGTGGALKHAESLLGQKHFVVHNADILSDIDLAFLLEQHLQSGNLATLAVHDYPRHNTVAVSRNGLVEAVGQMPPGGSGQFRMVAYTGIAAYSPGFLDYLPEGRSHVVDAWLRARSAGMLIGSVDVSGAFWRDIGTPDTYAATVFDRLREDGETVYIHPSSECGDIETQGHVVIEEACRISREVVLKDCIILPGSVVEGPASFESALIGNSYQVSFRTGGDELTGHAGLSGLADTLNTRPEDIRLRLIGTGGSDRRYYRAEYDSRSVVLMRCPADDPEIERQVAFTLFFRKHNLPVPELLSPPSPDPMHAPAEEDANQTRSVLFEDLGDVSLYSWLHCKRSSGRILAIYKKVLDILARLHGAVTAKSAECPHLRERVFDYDYLRWESSYFLKEFVGGLKKIAVPDDYNLDEEFQLLARRVDGIGKTVVHRDFQSQNIMVTRGDIPRIIDYQGARMGPPAYDIASLLWDPYVALEPDMRGELLSYYINALRTESGRAPEGPGVPETLLPCRLQRHMQALGAYAFLSSAKGKRYFLKYIPQAIAYLKEETFLAKDDYPSLFRLVHTFL